MVRRDGCIDLTHVIRDRDSRPGLNPWKPSGSEDRWSSAGGSKETAISSTAPAPLCWNRYRFVQVDAPRRCDEEESRPPLSLEGHRRFSRRQRCASHRRIRRRGCWDARPPFPPSLRLPDGGRLHEPAAQPGVPGCHRHPRACPANVAALFGRAAGSIPLHLGEEGGLLTITGAGSIWPATSTFYPGPRRRRRRQARPCWSAWCSRLQRTLDNFDRQYRFHLRRPPGPPARLDRGCSKPWARRSLHSAPAIMDLATVADFSGVPDCAIRSGRLNACRPSVPPLQEPRHEPAGQSPSARAAPPA